MFKLLNVVDEHTREALAMVAARSITAGTTVNTLDLFVLNRGTAPEYIRCDNGPEPTAHALRDWCRLSGTGTSYIEPGAPWENPFVSLLEAQVFIEDWRIECIQFLQHPSPGCRSLVPETWVGDPDS